MMDFRDENRNESFQGSDSYHSSQGNLTPNSRLAKAAKTVLKKSQFTHIVSEEAKFHRNSKLDMKAQDWDGKGAYEMVHPDISRADSTFIAFNQLPLDVKILTMVCSSQNTFLLSTQGKVYSWGTFNETLGRFATNKMEAKTPTQINELTEIIQLAAGQDHVLALDMQGCIYIWGSNQYGQLGVGQDVQNFAKPTLLDVFEDTVAQIYAGPTCSFAITKEGLLYSWGQNSYGQLGQFGASSFSPQKVSVTPWSKDTDIALVTGKSYAGYAFTTFTSSKRNVLKTAPKSLDVKSLEFRIKELEDNKKQLLQENRQLNENLVGGRPNSKLERNFEEDHIIRQLKDDEKITQEEIRILGQKSDHLKHEIEIIEDDLKNIRQQLREIANREDALIHEIHGYESEISKRHKNDKVIKEIERQRKTAEDLAKANEQIKNMIQKKENDREEKKIELANQRDLLVRKTTKLEERKGMISTLLIERKTTIAKGAFSENKSYILELIQKLHRIYKQTKDSTIEDVAKSLENEVSVLDVLRESNDHLLKFKKEVDSFKVNPTDALFDTVSKMLEMFQDNLTTRLKLNEYSQTLLLQLSDMLHENISKEITTRKVAENKKFKVKEAAVAALKQKYNLDSRPSIMKQPTEYNPTKNQNMSPSSPTIRATTPYETPKNYSIKPSPFSHT